MLVPVGCGSLEDGGGKISMVMSMRLHLMLDIYDQKWDH